MNDELQTPLLPADDASMQEDVMHTHSADVSNTRSPTSTDNFTMACVECDTSAAKNFIPLLHSNWSCIAAADNNDKESRVGRSKFYVQGICCPAEVPAVNSIIQPIHGVSKVSINPSTKMVLVDHDIDVISAADIKEILSKKGFLAILKMDAAKEIMMERILGIPRDIIVTSKFDMSTILGRDYGDNDKSKSYFLSINEIQSCLNAKFTEQQVHVKNVFQQQQTDLSSSSGTVVIIEHNPYYVTAKGVGEILSIHFKSSISVVSDGGKDGLWAIKKEHEDEAKQDSDVNATVPWTVSLSGLCWIVSMFSYIGGRAQYLEYVGILSVVLGIPHIATKAFLMLRQRRFDISCMVLIAAMGALALQDFPEAAGVTFLFTVSGTLETLANARTRRALSSLVDQRPVNTEVINSVTNERVVLPASAVSVGSIILVKPGKTIPCDGVVIEGQSTIDESRLTGGNKPVAKSLGSKVSSGTINIGTKLLIKTTATYNDSAFAKRIHFVEDAQATNSSDTEMLIESFVKVYTPLFVFTGLLMTTIPWAWGPEVGRYWSKNGLVAIAIACPCAFVISTPVTYVSALTAAAERGVLIKGGGHLETLAKVRSIAFDKTGTLTQGDFKLLHFQSFSRTRSREEVLGYLALMEKPANHPLSDAIVKGASNEQVDIPMLELKNHRELTGEGITATIENKTVYVGNKRLFQRLGLYKDLTQATIVTTEDWAQAGSTVGYISIEKEGIVGRYCVVDSIRDEAAQVAEALKHLGIEVTLLTGDQMYAAKKVGKQLGLDEDHVKGDLLPKAKMKLITDEVTQTNIRTKKCCNTRRAVMMVGDGVNDVHALSAADVSVAMGSGAAHAIDSSDITLIDSDLNKLLWLVRDVGRSVVWTIIENVAFSLFVKLVVVGFALAGYASLWVAVGSDVGTLVLVTLNGTRMLSLAPRQEKAKQSADRAPACLEDTATSVGSSEGSEVSTEICTLAKPVW